MGCRYMHAHVHRPKVSFGDHSYQNIQPSGSILDQTDMPSLNPESTFNRRDPFKAQFHPLTVGRVVSITHNHWNPLAATVATVGPDLVVQLTRLDQKLPFKEGDQVLIKYWNEDRAVYCWQAHVAKIAGQGYLTLSPLGDGMTIQQRQSYRVASAIPLSFIIIDAADTQLNGEKVSGVVSQNVSVGGVFFEQGFQLTVGDKLELQLDFPSSEPVHAVGWVVRCKPVSVDGRSLLSVAIEFLPTDEMNQYRLMESLARLQKLNH